MYCFGKTLQGFWRLMASLVFFYLTPLTHHVLLPSRELCTCRHFPYVTNLIFLSGPRMHGGGNDMHGTRRRSLGIASSRIMVARHCTLLND